MKCCICNQKMEKFDFNGLLIDQCPNCHSIWLDWLQLQKLVLEKGQKKDQHYIQGKKTIQKFKQNSIVDSNKGNCPSCHNSNLILKSINHNEVLYCQHCKGLLIYDQRSLKEIMSSFNDIQKMIIQFRLYLNEKINEGRK